MPISCNDKSDWQEGMFEKILPGVLLIGRLIYANDRFWGLWGEGFVHETFAGEDGLFMIYFEICQ